MSEDLVGSVLGGKYQVQRVIKRGGMGTVCEVRQLSSELRLAAKILNPQLSRSRELVRRFELEALAAAAIGHDNIVDVVDMGRTDGDTPYLVMEYLDGTNLDSLLHREGYLGTGRVARIAVQVLSGLGAAHDRGIIHRDLKPANVFLCHRPGRPETAKLLDFGISKFLAADDEVTTSLTQAGIILGTPWYMSPEQARGDLDLSPAADIYSMGVVLYEALTGMLPFDAPSYTALLIKITTTPPPDPLQLNPALPLRLAQIITKALSRDPRDRFASCEELQKQLLPFTKAQAGSFGRPSVNGSWRWGRRADEDSMETPVEVPHAGRVRTSIRTAVFAGLGRASDQIGLERGGWLRVISASDLAGTLESVEEFSPHLVVASSAVKNGGVEDLASTILDKLPGFRSPLIIVDLDSDAPGLTIHEWSVEQGGYAERRAPLEQLGDEIENQCVKEPVTCSRAADLQDIGYYDVIDREDHSLHVQTEVTTADEIRIRTIVFKNGTVADSNVSSCRSSKENIVRDSTVAAEAQHNDALTSVRQGKFD
jgi:serine/threonine protein kinase